MQDIPLEKLDKKHFAKGARVPEQHALASKQDDNSKEIALMEANIKKLCDLLDEVGKCCMGIVLLDFLGAEI